MRTATGLTRLIPGCSLVPRTTGLPGFYEPGPVRFGSISVVGGVGAYQPGKSTPGT